MFDSLDTATVIGAICGVVAAIFASVVIVRHLSGRQDLKLGMNLASGQKCPHCDANLPAVRHPKNFRQMMWGGWTCGNCGKEFDRWLKPVDENK
jgi:hypothetical protein